MYCPMCGKELTEGGKFCQFCGKRIGEPKTNEKQETAVTDNVSIAVTGNTKRSSAITWILGILVFALIASNFYFYSANTQLREDLDNTVQQRDTAREERDKAKKELVRAQISSVLYEEIKTWVKNHGSEYKADKTFYANTNVIFVRTGETVSLSVTSASNGSIYWSANTAYCEPEWSEGWTGSTTKLKITGTQVGTTVIDISRDTHKAQFQVLVCVYE